MKKKQYVSPVIIPHRVEMEGLIAQTTRVRVQEDSLKYTDYSDYPAATAATTLDMWCIDF
ncbi:MAG: hypothetical protein LBS46_02305 [Dysgonamonadaceae bacterium]|jgi:hypothetical protein|nr:hypothetical protein [Dysgonamonadaceae bacterium]